MTKPPWADRQPTIKELIDLIKRASEEKLDPSPDERRRLDEALKGLQDKLKETDASE
jgi:hypothetical protein